MHELVVIALAPLLLLLMLGMWAAIFLRRAASKFKRPKDAFWPSAENPGLALQFADSAD